MKLGKNTVKYCGLFCLNKPMPENEKPVKKERNKETFLLSEEVSSKIFETSVVPYLFRDSVRSAHPKVFFVGAQPGAGKTPLLRYITQNEVTDRNNLVEINGDDLRAFHPEYSRLLREDDESAAFFTDLDSARWIEQAITYAAERVGCSVGIEGTLRQHKIVQKTSALFRDHGYKTSLNVLVIHPLLSRLCIVERYLGQLADSGMGRFTLREAHDASVNALPYTVEQIILDHDVDEIRLYARGGIQSGYWTFRDQETLAVRDEIIHIILAARSGMSSEEVAYIEHTLPRIKIETLKVNKKHLSKEIEILERDFSVFKSQS